MTDRNALHATWASRNAPPLRQPHVDSEEAVQQDIRRVSRELDVIDPHSTTDSNTSAVSGGPDVRSRNASLRSSGEGLVRHSSGMSSATTQPDIPGASEAGVLSIRSSLRVPLWYDSVTNFWSHHVCPTLAEGAYRDHLALERTFLGYLRTSLILVMTGVLITQLFRLQHSENPDPQFGFYIVGLPLSVSFIGAALVVIIIGAVRFWKLQRGLIAGKAHTGGWEVLIIMGLSALLLLATFALVVGIDIDKSYFPP